MPAQKGKEINLSWAHLIPEGTDICPGGVNAYTNVFDEKNIQ